MQLCAGEEVSRLSWLWPLGGVQEAPAIPQGPEDNTAISEVSAGLIGPLVQKQRLLLSFGSLFQSVGLLQRVGLLQSVGLLPCCQL